MFHDADGPMLLGLESPISKETHLLIHLPTLSDPCIIRSPLTPFTLVEHASYDPVWSVTWLALFRGLSPLLVGPRSSMDRVLRGWGTAATSPTRRRSTAGAPSWSLPRRGACAARVPRALPCQSEQSEWRMGWAGSAAVMRKARVGDERFILRCLEDLPLQMWITSVRLYPNTPPNAQACALHMTVDSTTSSRRLGR